MTQQILSTEGIFYQGWQQDIVGQVPATKLTTVFTEINALCIFFCSAVSLRFVNGRSLD
jgi:hypothetical protein